MAEKVADVINDREDDTMELQPVWDNEGGLMSAKAASSAPLPQDGEVLRARLALPGTSWVMESYFHSATALVKGVRPFVFGEHADIYKGNVCGQLLRRPTICKPSWTPLLLHKHETRAQACSRGWEEGHGVILLTPLALEHRKRPYPWRRYARNRIFSPREIPKGRAKAALEGCAPVTPDGPKVCLNFKTKIIRRMNSPVVRRVRFRLQPTQRRSQSSKERPQQQFEFAVERSSAVLGVSEHMRCPYFLSGSEGSRTSGVVYYGFERKLGKVDDERSGFQQKNKKPRGLLHEVEEQFVDASAVIT